MFRKNRDTSNVNVAFSAYDARGALVENLTKDDFEMFEDAVPQKISFFARSNDVPLTLGLIVDFSGSQAQFSNQHQYDLEVFLNDVLGPSDRAFLVCFMCSAAANKHLYGKELSAKEIVGEGKVRTPAAGNALVGFLEKTSPKHVS